jgi:hypothetical protein
MAQTRLQHMLSIIGGALSEEKIPHALIGAMALSIYGMPRFTADIDVIAHEEHRRAISEIMRKLGYDCFEDTGMFAHFDSELGVYGRVDFMFVTTGEGRAIIERGVAVCDDVIGTAAVVQPTDYAVLKLMAMANDADRKAFDIADLATLFKAVAAGLMNPVFDPLDMDRLRKYASRFNVLKELEALAPWRDNAPEAGENG